MTTNNNGRFIGRINMTDEARKTKVTVFEGRHYSAEREGGTLVVYCLSDEFGMPAQEITTTDLSRLSSGHTANMPAGLREYNRRMAAHYGSRN